MIFHRYSWETCKMFDAHANWPLQEHIFRKTNLSRSVSWDNKMQDLALTIIPVQYPADWWYSFIRPFLRFFVILQKERGQNLIGFLVNKMAGIFPSILATAPKQNAWDTGSVGNVIRRFVANITSFIFRFWQQRLSMPIWETVLGN